MRSVAAQRLNDATCGPPAWLTGTLHDRGIRSVRSPLRRPPLFATPIATPLQGGRPERSGLLFKPAKSGGGKKKTSGDEADGDDKVAAVDAPPPPPPPTKLQKLTRSEVRSMFASKPSVMQRKKSEGSNGYRTRLHAACKVFGKKSPETFRYCDCQEFLMKALGFAELEDGASTAGSSSGSTAGSSSGSTAGSSSVSAAQVETKGWTRTPCSESGAFYYVHFDGRVQWEVLEEMQPTPKKLKPSGPPTPAAFGGAPVLTPTAASVGPMQLAVTGSSHGCGGSGDASMKWLSGMQRSGATINLAMVQRGAYLLRSCFGPFFFHTLEHGGRGVGTWVVGLGERRS